MRHVLHMNYIGLEEVTTLIAFWIYFIGGAKCSYDNTHISADLVSVMMPENTGKKIFVLIRSIITASLFLLATYFSFDLIEYAIINKTTTISLHMPMQYMYFSIPVGLILMSMYTIYHVVLNAKDLKQHLQATSR